MAMAISMQCSVRCAEHRVHAKRPRNMRRLGARLAALVVAAAALVLMSFGEHWLLRQAPAGRAVFVSSSSSQSAKPYWGLYAASKAALEAMVKSYAGEMQTTTVRANVFWPGAVRTAMRAAAFPGENPEKNPPPQTVAPKLVDMILPEFEANGMRFNFADGTLAAL